MTGPARRRPQLPLWLPAAGAFVGVVILIIRLVTVPLDQTHPWAALLVLAVAAVLVALSARAIARRGRVRAAEAAYPGALVLPVAGNVDTSAATRWLADRLGDPALALRPERTAILVVDRDGLRVVGGPTASAPLPAGMLSVLPLTTVRVGTRRADAVALGVRVGDVVAPLPFLPARTGFVSGGLPTDAELLDATGRLSDALEAS